MQHVAPRTVIIDAVWPATTIGRLRDITLVLAGALFIALSAQLEIPLTPVPITAQTFAVLLVAAAYGRKRGVATMATYLALGLVGAPVFAGGAAGIARLLGPTGGYLLSYLPTAFVVGWLSEKGWDRKLWSTALAMIIGNGIIYLTGVMWLSRFVAEGTALQAGVLPFLPGDALKIALATVLLPTVWRLIGRQRDTRST
jgi:biotin transport system substrate-specific component